MKRPRHRHALGIMLLLLTFGAATPGDPASQALPTPASGTQSFDAEAVFEMLKQGLVGEWTGTVEPISKPVEATFYLTGNGSALVEDIRRLDKDSRMHTVYHLDGDDLRLTHFCSFRNQPRLRAKSLSTDGKTVEFELVDVTNLSRSGNRYTHRMIVTLSDDHHVSVTYIGLDEGEEGFLTAELTRVSDRAY